MTCARHPNSPWTETLVAQLKSLWTAGHSGEEIAKTLGTGLTRDMVLGKAHRLRLPARRAGTTERSQGSEEQKLVRRLRKIKNRGARARVAKALKLPPRIAYADQSETPGGVKSLLALSPSGCRWPIGDPQDPGFSFCGAERDGCAYCANHKARAFTPMRAHAA